MLGQFFRRNRQTQLRLADVITRFTSAVSPRPSAAIEKDIAQAQGIIARALPVETHALKQFTSRLEALQLELAVIDIDKAYKRLDTSFLHCTHYSSQLGFESPSLATFGIDDPVCTLSAQVSGRLNHAGDLTGAIQIAAKPAFLANSQPAAVLKQQVRERLIKSMSYESKKDKSLILSLSAIFTGVLPTPVRDQLAAVKASFDQFYLVTEAPDWILNGTADLNSVSRETLLVAQKGNICWVITSFQRMTAQEYAPNLL